MNLFNVTAKVTLDTSGYNKGVDEIKNKTQEVGSSAEKNIKTIATNAYVQLGKEVLNVAGKIKDLTLDLVNYADRYGDLSAKYDISTQSLQEFEYIASQNGATLEELLSTMTMMYNRAKENADVFNQLGVSVNDTNGNMKSMDTLFWEVKTALDNVKNSGDKSALMLDVFGRNAMSMGEVLRRDTNELKDLVQQANDLGIVMQDNTIENAGKFNDMLDEMKLRGKSAFTEFLAGAEGSEEKVDAFIDDVVNKIGDNLPKFTVFAIKVLAKVIEALAKVFPETITALIDAIFEIDWLKVGWDIAKAIVQGIWNGLISLGKGALKLLGIDFEEEPTNKAYAQSASISDMDIVDTNGYEITERKSQTMEIKLTASGTTPIDEQNIKAIANQLIPIIDRGMGGI